MRARRRLQSTATNRPSRHAFAARTGWGLYVYCTGVSAWVFSTTAVFERRGVLGFSQEFEFSRVSIRLAETKSGATIVITHF